MDQIKVLVALPLEEQHLEAIRAVSPRVYLLYCPEPDDLRQHWAEAEVIYGWFFPDELGVPPKLKWIQLSGAGVDHLVASKIYKQVPIITTASGIHGIPMAEHVLGVMLMMVRNFPRLMRQQYERQELVRWRDLTASADELHGKTLAIVGLGQVGRAIAERARCFGLRVIASRRSTVEDESGLVERIYPPSQLIEMLREADFVVLTVPLTDETRKLIGEGELRGMKPTAYLINVARGGVVDEEFLLRALREGWIAGAALDVVEKEPLSFDNPLFDLPNVILTPHIAGWTWRYWERSVALFCDNLRRYLVGQPLVNIVDNERGY